METQKKRPVIITINIVLIVLSLLSIISKFTDWSKFQLNIKYFWTIITYFDYWIDMIIFISSILIVYGLFKARKWAWKWLFWLYGIILTWKVFGVLYWLIMRDKTMEIVATLNWGGNNISFEMLIWSSIAILALNGLVAFFILRSHYRAKNYFYK